MLGICAELRISVQKTFSIIIIGGSFRIKTKIQIAFTPTMLHSAEAKVWIRFARQETSAGARRYTRHGETIILRLATALGRRTI